VGVNRKGKGGWVWLISFVYVYENWTMKPVEIVLRSGEGGWERMMNKVNVNVTMKPPAQLIHTN
jgi:hypothetical protein